MNWETVVDRRVISLILFTTGINPVGSRIADHRNPVGSRIADY